jgi:hypothetical protein
MENAPAIAGCEALAADDLTVERDFLEGAFAARLLNRATWR